MTLRNALFDDLPRLLDLNESALPHVNSIELGDMEWYLEIAAYFKVVENPNSDLLGFMIALNPGLEYSSDNYRWFSDAYDDFYYIDRIVISEKGRGQGYGSLLYNDVIDTARRCAPVLTCEVNSRPPNPASMAFHNNFGFKSVGTQQTEGGSKEVTLMSLNLDNGDS
jgi:uncharacterized protein